MVACLSKRKAGVSEAQEKGSENKSWISADGGDFTGMGGNGISSNGSEKPLMGASKGLI